MGQPLFNSLSSSPDPKVLIERSRLMCPALKCHNEGELQFMLQMVRNQRLTKEDSYRDVRHFELEDRCSPISYQVGDALEILPSQDPSSVEAFINRCKLDPECHITIRAKGGDRLSKGSPTNSSMDPIKLKTFVALTMDVASASPRRYFFEIMSYFATYETEKEKLQYFTSPEGRNDLYSYNQKENRTVLEVLQEFPSVHMPFEWLVQLTPPLKKRAFSISSSPLVHPNQIQLTVSIVSWHTPLKRTRHGLCSTWLAGLCTNEKNIIPCWIYTEDPCLLHSHQFLSCLLDQEQDARRSVHLWRKGLCRVQQNQLLLFYSFSAVETKIVIFCTRNSG